MMLSGEGVLLRVFIGEADRHHGRPLSEVIVEAARKRGLAGATAWKGFMGFGAHSRIHTAKLLELSQDLPIIIEIVDAPEKILLFVSSWVCVSMPTTISQPFTVVSPSARAGASRWPADTHAPRRGAGSRKNGPP